MREVLDDGLGVLGVLERLALVLDHARSLTCRRRPVEAEDLHRRAGSRLEQLLAAKVVQRPHPRPGISGDDRVADAERAALYEHRGHRPSPLVEARFDDRAGRLGVGVRLELLELDVGHEEHLLEQLVEALARLRRDLRDLRRATPLLRLQTFVRKIAAHLVGVRVGKVDLVDRDDDRHVGRTRVRNRFLRLRHDAVVRSDDEDRDVGDLRAACTHGGERLVTRGVDERDPAAVVLDLVRTDVLRDAARLRLDDCSLADRVEQAGLAVVDVSHDRDDRGTQDEIRLGVLEDLGLLVLVGSVLDRHLALQLGGDQLDLLVGERLCGSAHLA